MKKKLWINRIIYFVVLVLSGTFATLYSGKTPKMIFFFLLALLPVSFVYTLIIYLHFRVWQEIPAIKVVKNQLVTYRFSISNEDFFTYNNVKVNFSDEYSSVTNTNMDEEFFLLPKSKEIRDAKICPKYRGTYFVGVKSVEVTDFLYLFHVCYPFNSGLKIIVWPRVLNLKRINLLENSLDTKNLRTNLRTESDFPDLELRKYAPGDNKKRIHWKASAKRGELLTRKNAEREEEKTFLYMDLSEVEKVNERIAAEDKVIEIALAISKYYVNKSEPMQIMYDGTGVRDTRKTVYLKKNTAYGGSDTRKQYEITNNKEFEYFYQDCVNLCFNSRFGVEEILKEVRERIQDAAVFIAISCKWNKEIYEELLILHKIGMEVIYFYIKVEENEDERLIDLLKRQDIGIYTIEPEADLERLMSEM